MFGFSLHNKHITGMLLLTVVLIEFGPGSVTYGSFSCVCCFVFLPGYLMIMLVIILTFGKKIIIVHFDVSSSEV